jgi:hypothetical protein
LAAKFGVSRERRNAEGDLDLADVGGKAGAATHDAMIARIND